MMARPFYASQDLPICGYMAKDVRGKMKPCERAPEDNMLRRCAEHAEATASGMLTAGPPPVDEPDERAAIKGEPRV